MPHPTSDRMLLVSAYAARMPASHVFSHLTAAELLGLRLPERWITGPLDVGALHPVRAPKARGVRGHELLARTRVVELHGVRVTAPVETWVALASRLPVDDLIVMGDGLVCRKNPVASVDDLQAAVTDARRRPGAAKLRRALLEIRPRTDSARETRLRLLLVRSGLPEPEVNGAILDAAGRFVGFGDLLYRAERLLLEYDGGDHRRDEGQFNRDVERLDDIMETGVRVIRVNKELLANAPKLLAKVRRNLAGRAPVPNRGK